MDTLAVVVSYNDQPNTLKTVESLLGRARIVVWDNHSEDGTVEALQKAYGRLITVHRSRENVLWTPALNSAVDLYRGAEKYVLFSNNDIRYEPDCVEILENVCKADPTVGVVGPTGSGMGGVQDFASNYGAKAAEYGWGGRPTSAFYRYISRLPIKRCNYIVGAAMLVPFSVWDEIGPLDESMPLGADDHDYCIRVKRAGYKIMVAYPAFVWHKSHSSYTRARDTWDEWGKRSWEAFNKKWAGYFHNEEEAKKAHWISEYTEGWDVGTGWMSPEEREEVWARRAAIAQEPRPQTRDASPQ